MTTRSFIYISIPTKFILDTTKLAKSNCSVFFFFLLNVLVFLSYHGELHIHQSLFLTVKAHLGGDSQFSAVDY